MAVKVQLILDRDSVNRWGTIYEYDDTSTDTYVSLDMKQAMYVDFDRPKRIAVTIEPIEKENI